MIKERVEKDINKLQEEFDSIDKQAFAAVEREHVTVANFVQHLRTVLIEYNVKHSEYYDQLYAKLCKDETLEYAWYRLSGQWSYLDYSLLDLIIHKCHDVELKAKMVAYKNEAKEFCRQTPLYDFARFYTPFSRSYSRLLQNGFVKATLAITWEDNHLENLMILKTYITQEFFMPSFSIVLKDIQPHDDMRYMVVLWATPPFLCKWLEKKMEEIDVQRFLGDNDIMQLCSGTH
ncbi:MAG: hypothetical protein A6F71_09350 [Cycloclasticus sp. symbiont of Poecilosclerida sp. M]|nr:MAG: hypothetical protein A6F71_09350 [Cycloclasticus sp. symbiont of Poecilosclerida sp. M]